MKEVKTMLYEPLLPPILSSEFLQSHVEVPMLGIVTGGAMAFMALLILSLIVLCLMQKNKTKSFGKISVFVYKWELEKVWLVHALLQLRGIIRLLVNFTDEPVEILMTKKR